MKRKIFSIIILLVFLVTTGFGCKVQDAEVKKAMEPVVISYWRVWDDYDAFAPIVAKYNALHPNIKIDYRKFRYAEYESELLNAMAEDRGPDIFSIPSTWIGKYKTKIAPMPNSTTLAYPIEKGTLKKEVIIEMRTNRSLTLKELRNNFIDVVYKDVVIKEVDPATKIEKENVYGLPLFVDTLAMYYNKDLLNNAGIPEPPAYWNKTFQQYVQKLTKQNTKGEIIQSGIGLGGSENIERASDIISVLMMQNGAEMLVNGSVNFAKNLRNSGSTDYNPGIEAVRFYIDFANPSKEVYTWNKDLDLSLKMFMNNKLGMFLGYAYHLPTIKAEAPKLNFGISKLPQIENAPKSVNFANYWVETVSKKSKNQNEAWDFIQFITKAEQAKDYLDKTKKPAALRSLVDGQLEDVEVGPFSEQVLTAKNWYQGKDALAAEKIMNDMISEASLNAEELPNAVNRAAQKIQQTIN